MSIVRFCAAAAAAFLLSGCSAEEARSRLAQFAAPGGAAGSAAAEPSFAPGAIRAHVEFLSDDLLEGREPGTPGYDIAANYVAAEFAKLGLAPGGEETSYFQQAPLTLMRRDMSGAALTISANGETRALEPLEQFIPGRKAAREESEVSGAVVFVGYGVDAPALGHNDYEGLDVDGKIVAYFGGFPPDWPSEAAAHYSSGREKNAAAARNGAVGMIYLYTPRSERRSSWERSQSFVDRTRATWIQKDGQAFDPSPEIIVQATLSPAASPYLFENAPVSYEDLRAAAEADEPIAGFDLNVEVSIAQRTIHERIESANVAGVLPGSDPDLADEYVVFTAHLDHLGLASSPVDGDAVNNGAMDNAAGVATMLDVARAFANAPDTPRRSLMFLAVTAEEKGLVGAEYFAYNPTVPIDDIVANVNLDMPVLLYDFADLVAFGAEHSSLKHNLEDALGEMGLTLSPDPMPEQNIFTRSDHYRFVQQGVPSVFLMTGVNTTNPDDEDGAGFEIFRHFLQTHYHRPSDQTDLGIDYDVGAKFAKVNYLIARDIANADARPTWNEGNFFGEIYGPDRMAAPANSAGSGLSR